MFVAWLSRLRYRSEGRRCSLRGGSDPQRTCGVRIIEDAGDAQNPLAASQPQQPEAPAADKSGRDNQATADEPEKKISPKEAEVLVRSVDQILKSLTKTRPYRSRKT